MNDYTHDQNGNLAARTGLEAFTFDVENRLVENAQWPGSFFQMKDAHTYNGQGERVRVRTSSGSGLVQPFSDAFMDGVYQEHYGANCTALARQQFNYTAFGRVIAQRTRTSSSTALSFLLADHLGSTTAVIGSGGTYGVKYWPFGGIRSGALASDRGFTGQYKEGPLTTTMDAYFYNARFYSPKTAHFMSADGDASDSLNRFSYVLNNPLLHTDSSGRCIDQSWFCDKTTALRVIGCGFKGWCAGAPPEMYLGVISLSIAILRGDYFFRLVQGWAIEDGAFASSVKSIRVTFGGDTSPILDAWVTSLRSGGRGPRSRVDVPGGAPQDQPGIPVVGAQGGMSGQVGWWIDMSYLDFEVHAKIDKIAGDGQDVQFYFVTNLDTFSAATNWDLRADGQEISRRYDHSLFDGYASVEIRFGLVVDSNVNRNSFYHDIDDSETSPHLLLPLPFY